jgi:hypothetical protein
MLMLPSAGTTKHFQNSINPKSAVDTASKVGHCIFPPNVTDSNHSPRREATSRAESNARLVDTSAPTLSFCKLNIKITR